jgi:hypothetical protein
LNHVWEPVVDGGAHVNFSSVDALIKQRNFFYDIASLNILPTMKKNNNNNNNNTIQDLSSINHDSSATTSSQRKSSRQLSNRNLNLNVDDNASVNSKSSSKHHGGGGGVEVSRAGMVSLSSFKSLNYVKRRKAEPLFSDDFALLKLFLNLRERRHQQLEMVLKLQASSQDIHSDDESEAMPSLEVFDCF